MHPRNRILKRKSVLRKLEHAAGIHAYRSQHVNRRQRIVLRPFGNSDIRKFERRRRNQRTQNAVESKSRLVQELRADRVSIRDRKNTEIAFYIVRKSRHVSRPHKRAHRKRYSLVAVREKEARRNLVARRLQVIRINHELIFIEFARLRKS